jgi:hypothetical protein
MVAEVSVDMLTSRLQCITGPCCTQRSLISLVQLLRAT